MASEKESGIGVAAAGLDESDLRRKSRIAAFWYLAITVTGPLVVFYFPAKFFVPGDAAATIANITARQSLFRLGIVVDFVSMLSFLLTAIALYALLKPVDRAQARAMVALVVVSVSLAFANVLFKVAPLLLTGGAGFLKDFAPGQVRSLAVLFLEIHKQGNQISQIFWGLWLLPLGILVFRSGFFPKILGVLQMIACFGYLAGFLAAFLFPGPRGMIRAVINVMILGELPFILWLVVRGARLKPPRKAAPAGA